MSPKNGVVVHLIREVADIAANMRHLNIAANMRHLTQQNAAIQLLLHQIQVQGSMKIPPNMPHPDFSNPIIEVHEENI